MLTMTYDLFKQTIERCAESFGMSDWQINIRCKKLDTDNETHITISRPRRIATIWFNTDYENKFTDFQTRKLAATCLMYLLLDDLEYVVREEDNEELLARYKDTQGAIVNKLVNFISNQSFKYIGERGIPGDPRGPEC